MKTAAFIAVLTACLSVCMAVVNYSVVLHALNPRPKVGQTLKFSCTDEFPSSEFNRMLYKVQKNGANLPVSNLSEEHLCIKSGNGKQHHTCKFSIKNVTEEATGTYMCKVNGTRSIETQEIVVCREPVLTNNMTTTSPKGIVVKLSDECEFQGVISWLVNGYHVQRESGASSQGNPFPAIQRDDDSLELNGSAECEPRSVCNVTAEYTYIVTAEYTYIWQRRMKTLVHSPDLQYCCMLDEEPTTPLQPQASTSPTSESDCNCTCKECKESQLFSDARTVVPSVLLVVFVVSTVIFLVASYYYRRELKNAQSTKMSRLEL